jgi:putative transposase
MSKKRRQHNSEFKFKIALEAAKGTKTVAEVASEAGVHPNQISQWKSQLLGGCYHRSLREFEQREAFVVRADRAPEDRARLAEKKLPGSVEARRTMIEINHVHLSLRRQCELIGLPRSTYYYEPKCLRL